MTTEHQHQLPASDALSVLGDEGEVDSASLVDHDLSRTPYLTPQQLLEGLRSGEPRLESDTLSTFVEAGVACTEVLVLSEMFEGEPIRIHGWLCRPSDDERPLVPVLLIPDGPGRWSDHEEARWIAGHGQMAVFAVDWAGAGRSDPLPGLDPYHNAFRFDGDYRSSYQHHQLRSLLRATDWLLAQPHVVSEQLIALGGGWGGFYTWLLAGLDERFTHIFPTFGAGFHDLETRSVWESQLISMGADKREQWLRAFDPGRRAHLVGAAVHYQHATNDRFFSLVQGIETYRRVRAEKRLLLVHNQDQSIQPYSGQLMAALSSAITGSPWRGFPSVGSVRWLPGSNLVEIDAEPRSDLTASVNFSASGYTKSFGRYWRRSPAELRDGRWVAEIPVVDPDRELWFYGHVEDSAEPATYSLSTPVQRVVPSAAGLAQATATFDPSFEFESESVCDAPVGDRHWPRMDLVDDGGTRALAMRFGDDPSRRGVIYCLEGDLIAADGFDAIDVAIRVPNRDDVAGLKLCLVTDFNALSEQDYVVELEELECDLGEWQSIRCSLADFKPIMSQRFDFYQPPLQPMDVGRLCGVGFYHPSRSYTGEALIGSVSVVHHEDPLPAPKPASTVAEPRPRSTTDRSSHPADGDRYGYFISTDLPPDQLRSQLRAWAPWRYEVVFSNGVRTTEFEIAQPFVEQPASKWHVFKDHIPPDALMGKRALDVGSNIGHYSVFLRRQFGMEVLGIENSPRNLDVANFLLGLSTLNKVRYVNADANVFRTEEQFDLILHLGTLDHFKNPFQAIDNAAAMLAPGGTMALELQTYKDPSGDETVCKFQPHTAGTDFSVWWLLGRDALENMLLQAGFSEVTVLLEWAAPEKIGPTMRRLNLVARKD